GGVSTQTASQVANTVAKVVAERVSTGQAVDMSQPSTVESVIQRSAQILGATLGADVQQTSAGVIAEGNQIKDDAVARAASPMEASREITRAQVIIQGEIPPVLTQIAASASTPAEVLATISGASLAQKVQAAPVGDVQGDDTRPGTFYFGQTTFRLQTSRPDQANVTVYRTLGNRGPVSLTIALSVNGEPPRAAVRVTFADREISKTVDLAGALRNESALYYQATVGLRLVLDASAPPLAALGVPAAATLAKVPPTITVRLQDQIAIRNEPFTLAVSATGAPQPSYRWQKNGIDLPSETSSRLSVRSADLSDSGAYTVIVSNPAGSASDTATVTVVERVRILSPPTNQSVYAGDSTTLDVVAEGTPPLRFQWLKNERVIPGATEAKLALKDVQVADAGRYAVVITNPAGSVISPEATLSVQAFRPPAIVSQVLRQTAREGDNVTFSVEVIGTLPLNFEWQKDGKVIAGATGPVLELNTVSPADAGQYSVTVRNPYGASSSTGALTVYSPPRILASPQDLEVPQGAEVSYSVEAVGSAPLQYAWFKNGDLMPTATNSTLILQGVREADSGSYRVVVSNGFGQAASPEFNLQVVQFEPPIITLQPSNRSALPGATVEFTVEASGRAPLGYQWFKNEIPIPGATNRVLTLSAVNDSDLGTYSVMVKNPRGFVKSSGAALTFGIPSLAIAKPARLPDGRFSFSFPAQAGKTYVIEFSTDLQTWQTLPPVSSGSSQVTFVDPDSPGSGLRFYRVVQMP
ncbi:MAG: immunoglobulin domain-containing protein, partial [Verrucomicrobia bacterium]|nr:immunoglobulin domain-containing protein [Verrucomicrobiota bacterium]